MNIKSIIIVCILCWSNLGYAQERDTSLFEATVCTGLPALAITTAIWLKPLSQEENLWNNFAWGLQHPPVWDKNPWYVNYVGHPLTGSEWYLLARNRNYTRLQSFAYSSIASIVWEYGIESWIGARPSIQDLLITSTTGSLIGELRYYAKHQLMKEPVSTLDKIGIVLLDPIDAMYVTFE